METDIDSENLIALVFERKALWDKTLKHYRNRLIVDKLWREVSSQLGGDSTMDAVKKKWKNLRTTFAKEMKKIPAGRSGDAGPSNYETYTTWPFFELMYFLKDQVKPRKSGGNLVAGGGNEDDLEDADSQEVAVENIPDDSTDNPDLFEATSVAETLHHPSPKPQPRSGKRGVQQQLVDIEARKLRLLENKVRKSSAADDDEDEAFFKSLLPHVRKLEPEEKLEFQMEVQSLVRNLVYKKTRTSNNPNVVNRADFDMNASQASCSYQRTPPRQEQAEIVMADYQDEPMTTLGQHSTG